MLMNAISMIHGDETQPDGTVLPLQFIEISSATVEIKNIFSGTVATPSLLQLNHRYLAVQ